MELAQAWPTVPWQRQAPSVISRNICSPSTTDAHVALQQLSHHVPYQVLPPNGGERK
ncbi:unnamed protein product [Tetraodon nigroviridis]|uniref:(spotted green pufferfish) hypothetical protein n=1 Tax=Tetraodon nigroviridis TaxID=99883 RepID=Q4SWG4_TETNG|nr:unnamed protein product [Tetraodon nigroviridis]